MTDIDLLSRVQPADGYFAIVGIDTDGDVRQQLLPTRKDADFIINRFADQGRNVYFGVAKFETDENRTKRNVRGLKSFWIDIDCGPTKVAPNPKTGRPAGYATQDEALDALRDFCANVGLPLPLLVNSGRGIHSYWPLMQEVTREEWEPVAHQFRDLCVAQNLYVDPVVFEAARILRVPGTFNYKDDPPSEVTVLRDCLDIDFKTFARIVGATDDVLAQHKFAPTALQKKLNEARVSSFRRIVQRSLSGEGCEQIKYAVLHADALSEPQWFDALSVAHHCHDRDTAIHKLSSGHPEYDPAATEAKTQHIKGPHNCETFERNNPGGCADCKWNGKIRNPITLGHEIIEADKEDNLFRIEDEETGEQTVYVIPEYPWPFFRGVKGGVFRHPLEEEGEPIMVYPYDIYCVKRMRDPVLHDVVMLRVHTPQDGVEEFMIPMGTITEQVDLRKQLAARSIICSGKKFALLHDFLLSMVHELHANKKVEKMRQQFGWVNADSRFVLGTKEISVDGIYHSPAPSSTAKFAERIGPVGSYEKWKEVFALYNTPGLEPHAFAALTAFGAPLIKFFGHKGLIINLVHPHSGTGKTTILHMCNSVYGSPSELCSIQDDTLNAKLMRLGIMSNLPYTVDEITNMEPKDFSVLSYAMSQGRGKDRVRGASNELRVNNTTWETISLCSSNASFYDKLQSIKRSPEGEMMRLLEYTIEPLKVLDTALAKQMFDHELKRNYGHAGEIYISWLVHNLDEAKATCMRVQEMVDRELKLEQKERFWSAGIAANIAGGLIARKLDIMDWDIKRIYNKMLNVVNETRRYVNTPPDDAVHVIGDFINRHTQNILVVNDAIDARSKLESLPVVEPRGALLIRYEPDTRRLYISSTAFRRDCSDRQINMNAILKDLESRSIFLGRATKRMSKGMRMASTGIETLLFDCTASEFVSIDDIHYEYENARKAQLAEVDAETATAGDPGVFGGGS